MLLRIGDSSEGMPDGVLYIFEALIRDAFYDKINAYLQKGGYWTWN